MARGEGGRRSWPERDAAPWVELGGRGLGQGNQVYTWPGGAGIQVYMRQVEVGDPGVHLGIRWPIQVLEGAGERP